MPAEAPATITVDTAARLASVSPDSILGAIRRRELRARRIGKQYVISVRAFAHFIGCNETYVRGLLAERSS